MGYRVRKNIDDDHSGYNQCQSDDSRQIEMLFENEKADQCDKDNAHPRPDSISYTYRNAFQYNTQAIECSRITQEREYGRHEFRKLPTLFQKRSGYSLKNDSQKQNKIRFHHSQLDFLQIPHKKATLRSNNGRTLFHLHHRSCR